MALNEKTVDEFFANIESNPKENKTANDFIEQFNKDIGNQNQVELSTDQVEQLNKTIDSYQQHTIMFNGAIKKMERIINPPSKTQRKVNPYVEMSAGYRPPQPKSQGLNMSKVLTSYKDAKQKVLDKLKTDFKNKINKFTNSKSLDSNKENKRGGENRAR